MNQDFEALPIGTEAALRTLVAALEGPKRITWEYETKALEQGRAILSQIDATRQEPKP